jgi:hypothetical protein
MTGSWLFDWVIWASVGIGIVVTGLVFVLGRVMRPIRLRRRMHQAFKDETVPWEDLVDLMKQRFADGRPGSDEPDQLLDSLLGELPEAAGTITGADWTAAPERRRSLRRWFNPVEVVLISPLHDQPLHGLVVNRSTGGLAILTDVSFDAETVLSIRPLEAPAGVGYVYIRVRHSRKASRLWVIGCEYKGDVAWNVKVWFG